MPTVSPSEIEQLMASGFTGSARFPGPATSHPDRYETTQHVRVTDRSSVVRSLTAVLGDGETVYVEAHFAQGSIKRYEVHRSHQPTGSVELREAG